MTEYTIQGWPRTVEELHRRLAQAKLPEAAQKGLEDS